MQHDNILKRFILAFAPSPNSPGGGGGGGGCRPRHFELLSRLICNMSFVPLFSCEIVSENIEN